MKQLKLTDLEAHFLITLPKRIETEHIGMIRRVPPVQNEFLVTSVVSYRNFRIVYYLSEKKSQIHLMDEKTKHTLVRVNLDSNFHMNADGKKVRGNRILLFSEDEFAKKDDRFTHCKATLFLMGVFLILRTS